jgi:hypothetical protein
MSEQSLPAPPSLVADLADGCVRSVKQAVGVELDYTQDTLPILDHYAAMVPAESDDEVLGLVGPMVGAYFGEVIRRELPGARWHAPPDDYEAWRIEFDPCFLHFNPIGMAFEAVFGDEVEGWSGHLQVLDEERESLKEALEQLGEVPEEDFYRLSVRYEVVEKACRFLSDRREDADQRRRFGPEVYAAVLDKPSPHGVPH